MKEMKLKRKKLFIMVLIQLSKINQRMFSVFVISLHHTIIHLSMLLIYLVEKRTSEFPVSLESLMLLGGMKVKADREESSPYAGKCQIYLFILKFICYRFIFIRSFYER